MAIVGVALLLGSAAAFIPIPIFVWLIQYQFISREEEFLEEFFGEEYLAYKGEVRRWLLVMEPNHGITRMRVKDLTPLRQRLPVLQDSACRVVSEDARYATAGMRG